MAAAASGGLQPKSAARDMMRACLRGCKLPSPYFVDCPLKHKKRGSYTAPVAVILPHELLNVLVAESVDNMDEFCNYPADSNTANRLQRFRTQVNVAADQKVFALGIWGDGVPFAAKMRDSLEVILWSFSFKAASPRFLFAALPKSCMISKTTCDKLFEVLAWSCRVMMHGAMPRCRHDGSPWSLQDKGRSAAGGKPLGFRACLTQVRGDWSFYKAAFDFNSWSNTSICWMCSATNGPPHDFRNTGPGASWRTCRLTGHMWLAALRAKGHVPSSLFAVPFFEVEDVLPDWLHTVDLGVQSDVVGNLFADVLPLLPGANKGEHVAALWAKLSSWYSAARPPAQLEDLTAEMIQKKPGIPPKLRGKAAQVRHLLPFAVLLAQEFQHVSAHFQAVAHLFQWLDKVASCLRTEPWDAALAAGACCRFCLLYASLEAEARAAGNFVSWRLKPKVHLFQELVEYVAPRVGCPLLYHTYLDESIGGWLAACGARRGGAKNGPQVALNVVSRFRAFATEGL